VQSKTAGARASRAHSVIRAHSVSTQSNGNCGGACASYATANTGLNSMAVGDLRGIGLQDIVTSTGSGISVLLNNGNGTFAPAVTYAASMGDHPNSVAVGDLLGNGHLDVVTSNGCPNPSTCNTSDFVSVYLGNSRGTFQTPPVDFNVGYNTFDVALGDMNHDGKLDIVTGNVTGSTGAGVSVLLNTSSGSTLSFGSATNYPVPGGNSGAGKVVLADLNKSGWLDVVSLDAGQGGTGSGYPHFGVFMNTADGTGNLNPETYYGVGGTYDGIWDLAVGDLNGDGFPDVVVTTDTTDCGSTPQTEAWLNNGSGVFSDSGSIPTGDVIHGSCDTSVAIGEVNGDGHADIITGRLTTVGGNLYDNAVAFYAGNGDGTFQSPTISPADTASCANDVAAADVNNDGKADILSVRCGPGVVDVYIQSGSQSPCTPPSNLLTNPGFEDLPVGTGGVPQTPVTNGWFAVSRNNGSPSRDSKVVHCGQYSGLVQGGYWVQDVPSSFDPTQPFEFSFWFNAADRQNQVTLFDNWRTAPVYLFSMGLTRTPDPNTFQVLVVVDGRTVRGAPTVSKVGSNTGWHEFDAIWSGTSRVAQLRMDGQLFASTEVKSPPPVSPTDQVTVVMGAQGGRNSVGPTDVNYDDVYVGPITGSPVQPPTTMTLTASPNPAQPAAPPGAPNPIDQPYPYSASVKYTASVSDQAPFTGVPQGTVTFSQDGVPIPQCNALPLNKAGKAPCTVAYTTIAQHQISASYSGTSQPQTGSITENMAGTPLDTTTQGGHIGYAQQAFGSPTYVGVEGQWQVPAITGMGSTCSSNGSQVEKASATWIGVGGLYKQGQDLLQIGTTASIIGPPGHLMPQYTVWWERIGSGQIPPQPLLTNVTLCPGALVQASISLQPNNQWFLWISVTQNGATYHERVPPQTYSPSNSVEAIHEWTNGGALGPLTPTSPVDFDCLQYANSEPAGSPNWVPFFSTPSGPTTWDFFVNTSKAKATASPVNTYGDGFEVQYGTTKMPNPPTGTPPMSCMFAAP
jgi:FG-GAP-like repeat/Bacterial Ig-like domain (group 3)